MFYLSVRSKNNMIGIHHSLLEIANRAIEITTIDFGIPIDGGLRTNSRQKELFLTGKSKADGYVKLSNHQSGEAIDFYAYVDGKASWEREHLAIVAAAFLQAACELGYKIRWGGFFKSFTDMPHIELIN